jgi:glycosyltransferase involved in cell wall biosynthesis
MDSACGNHYSFSIQIVYIDAQGQLKRPSRCTPTAGQGATVRELLLTALDALTDETDLVAAIWASFRLPLLARSTGRQFDTERLARTITGCAPYGDDFLFRITALSVLGVLGGTHARASLVAEVHSGDPRTRPYAALALAGNVRAESVPALAALLHSPDSFARMAAQDALLSVGHGPAAVAAHCALLSIAPSDALPSTRIAAIECLTATGLQPSTLPTLRRLAGDERELRGVQAAAIRALVRLGDMTSISSLEDSALPSPSLAERGAAVEAVAALGPHGHHTLKRTAAARTETAWATLQAPPPLRTGGMHLAQFVSADTGGLSTLIADLHAAFSRRTDIGQITSLTWGGTAGVRSQSFGAEPPAPEDDGPPPWDAAIRIERGLDGHFHRGLPHVLHLRFADVGTMAAARWAQRRGVPVYFTFAPDPIVPMRIAVESGLLTRETLADADARDRLIIRTSILQGLARTAQGIALLPRTDRAIQSLGPGIFAGPTRSIAEGIDVDSVSRLRVTDSSPHAVLDQAWSPGYGCGLRPERQGLPMLVSVGRLHPVKGLARLVEAWAGDPDLARSVNVVILGGSLEAPNDTERPVLDEILRIVRLHPEVAGGLLLTGAQPHDRVPGLLAALRDGLDGLTAPRSIYVCPSTKEEFGLAILEAMAVGLPVVAPDGGGPATYLQDGTLGFLTNTMDVSALAGTLRRALSLRDDVVAYEEMSARGRHAVREHYAVDRMAAELMNLYREGADVRLASAS